MRILAPLPIRGRDQIESKVTRQEYLSTRLLGCTSRHLAAVARKEVDCTKAVPRQVAADRDRTTA